MWLHKVRGNEDYIKEHFKRHKCYPDWYADAPEQREGDEIFLDAFADLSTCRPGGMAVYPIPWTAVHQYAGFRGYDRHFTDVFHRVISAMDGAFLKWLASQTSKS